MRSAGTYELSANTKALLTAGLVAGPLFVATVLAQATFREGFSVARIPLSELAVGEMGWIQTANFIVSGLLVIASSVGVSRVISVGLGRRFVAPLLGLYGVGLFSAGIFMSDPMDNFPVGARQPSEISWHAQLHGLSFALAQVSVVLCCAILSCRFISLRRFRWAAYSLLMGLITVGLVVVGFRDPAIMGAAFFGTAVVTFLWLGTYLYDLITADTEGLRRASAALSRLADPVRGSGVPPERRR